MMKIADTGHRIGIIPLISIVALMGMLLSGCSGANDAASEGVFIAEGAGIGSTADKAARQTIRTVLNAASSRSDVLPLTIVYPPNEAVFPQEFPAPLFAWRDSASSADSWLVDIAFADSAAHIYILTLGDPLQSPVIDSLCVSATNKPPPSSLFGEDAVYWTPGRRVWQSTKTLSLERAAKVTVYGFSSSDPSTVLSRGIMRMTTSGDPVDGLLFYRDVPLMSSTGKGGAIQPLSTSALPLIKWHLRDMSQPESRVVLTNVPTCANCHSFSRDGSRLGMDIDGPQTDKGSYTIKTIEKNMVIAYDDIISWNHLFTDKPKGQKTIGLLSQVSPDGRYAVTTLNEALYVENYLEYQFLQVFYPTRGILGYYSRDIKKVAALPGADNPSYVQCDPVWSPDGSFLVFARAAAKDPYEEGVKPASYANSPDELPIQYDLYRIPFNGGKGGKPEPIPGASANGMSNSFPKITPDGRFIVFVKCRNGQLMRPDSRLWIVPVEGGEAREMACNTPLMNSWHTFSPNGRWMVFSSKSLSPYTQLFITHLDANGMDTPPLLIPNSTAANRAANIPEFVAINNGDLLDITITGMEYARAINRAIALYYDGKLTESLALLKETLASCPDDRNIKAEIIEQMGEACFVNGSFDEAAGYFAEAVRIDSDCTAAFVTHGQMLEKQGRFTEAADSYNKALAIDPKNTKALFYLAAIRRTSSDPALKNIPESISLLTSACRITNYHDAGAMAALAESYAAAGDYSTALKKAASALAIARNQNLPRFIAMTERLIETIKKSSGKH